MARRRHKARRNPKKGMKILGLSLPTLAVGAIAVWYFFIRKKSVTGITA